DQQAAAGRIGLEPQFSIDHELAQPPDAGDLRDAFGHHLVERPRRTKAIAGLPAELVDQQLLELLGLDADVLGLLLVAEQDHLADDLVQGNPLQYGVDVENSILQAHEYDRRVVSLLVMAALAGVEANKLDVEFRGPLLRR